MNLNAEIVTLIQISNVLINILKKLQAKLTKIYAPNLIHTNYIHLPMPPWLMRGVVTFKMLGSINELIRRILMTPRVTKVIYTKNSYFICKTNCETNRAY